MLTASAGQVALRPGISLGPGLHEGKSHGVAGQRTAANLHRQIIVGHGLTNSTSDQGQLVPLVDAIESNLGRRPKEISADAGYCSEANLEAAHARGIKPYIATGRQKHGQAAAVGARGRRAGGRVAAMATTLKRAGHRSRYRLRKQTVEPVFGHIKQARGFRQFLLRGRDKVESEWAMICTAHNLAKLSLAQAA